MSYQSALQIDDLQSHQVWAKSLIDYQVQSFRTEAVIVSKAILAETTLDGTNWGLSVITPFSLVDLATAFWLWLPVRNRRGRRRLVEIRVEIGRFGMCPKEDMAVVPLPDDWEAALRKGEQLDIHVLAGEDYPTIGEFCEFHSVKISGEADPEDQIGSFGVLILRAEAQ